MSGLLGMFAMVHTMNIRSCSFGSFLARQQRIGIEGQREVKGWGLFRRFEVWKVPNLLAILLVSVRDKTRQ